MFFLVHLEGLEKKGRKKDTGEKGRKNISSSSSLMSFLSILDDDDE